MATSHEVELSQFELYRNQDELALRIDVEQTDFINLWKGFKDLSFDEKTAKINDYLQRKTAWKFNSISFSICNYTFIEKERHFIIMGVFDEAPKKIKKVHLTNEFLIDEIYNHMNIIHFNLNKRFRSFKMDKDRQEIKVTFQ